MGAPESSHFAHQRPTYLLVPLDSALADSAFTASAYFFPEKRISLSDLCPSLLVLVTTESRVGDCSRSSMWAGTVATTFLPFRIFSSTFGPAPSHVTLYVPEASCFPFMVTGSFTWME